MGRPAKAIKTNSMKMSKEERKKREETEEKLRGKDNEIKPFRYLNNRQKKIFKFILNNLNKDILGNLDVYILNQTAITIERLESIEKKINEEGIDVLLNSNYKAMRDMYSKDFYRCCNELSLSPQARAKLSISSIPPTKKSILDMLTEDDQGD